MQKEVSHTQFGFNRAKKNGLFSKNTILANLSDKLQLFSVFPYI